MANPVNVFDFTNEDLATFLAKSVSDGTYNNVFGTLKVDQTGEDAAATQIIEKIGQLWGNALDDFVLSGYPHIRNVALGNGGLLHTTGAAKTGAYTALAGELVRYDATGGTFTVEVPASPADNTRFGIVEIGDDGTQITIDAGSDTVIGPGGTSGTTLLLGSELTALIWEFSSDDSTWSLVSEAGAVGGGGAVTHASTTGQTTDDHHAQLHAAAHSDGGGDEITVEDLATDSSNTAHVVKPDGAGGLVVGAAPAGAASSLAATLAVGDTTGGEDIQYGAGTSKLDPPTVLTREYNQISGGASAWVNVGAALWVHDTTTSVNEDTILIEVMASARWSAGTNATTIFGIARFTSAIELAAAGIVELEQPDAFFVNLAGALRLETVTSGTDRELYLQVNELSDASRTVQVSARVTVTGVRSEAT